MGRIGALGQLIAVVFHHHFKRFAGTVDDALGTVKIW
jgi:hypothetical protein